MTYTLLIVYIASVLSTSPLPAQEVIDRNLTLKKCLRLSRIVQETEKEYKVRLYCVPER